MSDFPFVQHKKDGYIVREFDSSVNEQELVWHMDEHDRLVEVIEGNQWQLQYDNKLPEVLQENKKYFIPKLSWHRVIRGNGKLKIKIYEYK